MNNITKAMQNLNRSLNKENPRKIMPSNDFLANLSSRPDTLLRNIFQLFHDMIKAYIKDGINEYPDDPESINYAYYDCSQLFIKGCDHPFFADRIFANRLINLVGAMKRGIQQNKIYIFEGPHGSGKSTFLNNLLIKFEEYANTMDGQTYETVWRLDRKMFRGSPQQETIPSVTHLIEMINKSQGNEKEMFPLNNNKFQCEAYLEIPCPSHDHPILMIPKHHRRSFFKDFFEDEGFKKKLFNNKEYEWVLKDNPCTICSTLYQALLDKGIKPAEIFKMIYARHYIFNRRLGNGISIFNPGDKPLKQDNSLRNEIIQTQMDKIFCDSNRVKYLFSRFAKTNNGIYALMDIKSHNRERLDELHNIISEGIHKVEDIEENVNSLFLALINPEDKSNIRDFHSYSDRIEFIKISYIMDFHTEVELYTDIFGKQIHDSFLPRVLANFARIIISSRLNLRSEALLEWIDDPQKYSLYCDKNLQLLKMEIYAGNIPSWISEEDLKRLTAKRRRNIISESETDGTRGYSGRDSIKLFNDFYSTYAKEKKLINMSMLCDFFRKLRERKKGLIPDDFLESLLQMYNYTMLQNVKESLYYYNEKQISNKIQNFLFSVNFDIGATITNKFTGSKLKITNDFFEGIENYLLGSNVAQKERIIFRKDVQKEYTSKTLTQEIILEGLPLTETKLYQSLYDKYVHNLKDKVLDPFLENENFRQAIKDYGKEAFKTYDKKIRDDVSFMMDNLRNNYNYTKQGAKEICIYVIDNDLARKFSTNNTRSADSN